MPTVLSSGHELDPRTRRMLHLAQNLRDLGSRDSTSSTAAAGRLSESAPTSAELVELIADRNPFIRSGAAWWMRNLAGDLSHDVINALRAAICDPNAHVVQAALGSAGVLRLAVARDRCRALVWMTPMPAWFIPPFALGRIGSAEEGAHLSKLLDHPASTLELATVTALTHQVMDRRPSRCREGWRIVEAWFAELGSTSSCRAAVWSRWLLFRSASRFPC